MSGKSEPITLEDLQERQAEQHRQVSLLRALRSDAILEGKKFDKAKLREAEDELSALDEAIEEFKRREEDRQIAEAEAAAAVTEQERIEETIAEIRAKAKERDLAIGSAETAARSFAKAVVRAETARKALQATVHGFSGSVPIGLMAGGQEDRLAKGFAAVLSAAIGKGNFGELKLHKGMRTGDQPWLASEQFVSRDIEATLQADQAEGTDK